MSACEAPGAERGACLSAPREFRENCGIPEISWKSPEESAKLRSVASGVKNVRSSLKFRKSKPKRAKTAHRRSHEACAARADSAAASLEEVASTDTSRGKRLEVCAGRFGARDREELN